MQKSNNDMLLSLIVLAAIACLLLYNFINPFFSSTQNDSTSSKKEKIEMTQFVLTEAEWKKHLTPLQYEVMRKGASEPAFSGKYYDFKEKGTYNCAACSLPLFSSADKFDAKTGWASFTKPINESNVWNKKNVWLFWSNNEEVFCSRCDSFLGHVFHDGPPPTSTRYSINSIALNFVAEKPEVPTQKREIIPSNPITPQESK